LRGGESVVKVLLTPDTRDVKQLTKEIDMADEQETITPKHEMKDGLKKFHEQKKVEAAVVVEDAAPQVKRVQVKGLDSGMFRVGPEMYAITKGQNTLLPESVANYLRECGKVG
jgi:hypothetical protein